MGNYITLIHLIMASSLFLSVSLAAQTSTASLPRLNEAREKHDIDLHPIQLRNDDPDYLAHVNAVKNRQRQRERAAHVESPEQTVMQEHTIQLPAPVEIHQQQRNTSQVFLFHTGANRNTVTAPSQAGRPTENLNNTERLSYQFRASHIEALRQAAARKNK
ncbi:hypothetical protein [Agarilytica rhodophyticola]|uniref:hypothetical protein n=1 Tax=Agarilytica rhodophyticola TaxID=1737490 RepID=UPI000B345C47|nr:hypothetical protein [Agarilytica rhodophyticola]